MPKMWHTKWIHGITKQQSSDVIKIWSSRAENCFFFFYKVAHRWKLGVSSSWIYQIVLPRWKSWIRDGGLNLCSFSGAWNRAQFNWSRSPGINQISKQRRNRVKMRDRPLSIFLNHHNNKQTINLFIHWHGVKLILHISQSIAYHACNIPIITAVPDRFKKLSMEGITSEKVDVRGKSIHVLRSGHGQQVANLIKLRIRCSITSETLLWILCSSRSNDIQAISGFCWTRFSLIPETEQQCFKIRVTIKETHRPPNWEQILSVPVFCNPLNHKCDPILKWT